MLASITEQHDFCCAAGANGHAHEQAAVVVIACGNTVDGFLRADTVLVIVIGVRIYSS